MTGIGPSYFRIDTALNSNWTLNEQVNMANYLPKEQPTITKILQDNGYNTGHFGKWHLGAGNGIINNKMSYAPNVTDYGIDEQCTFNSEYSGCDGLDLVGPLGSKNIIDKSIEFLNNNQKNKDNKPFYMNVWLHIAHAELIPNYEQIQECHQHTPLCSCRLLNANNTLCAEEIYYAMQLDADKQIGRLITYLENNHLMDNTLVVFTTDNGPEEEPVYIYARGNTGPFRGKKRSLYEGGIRVPYIAAGLNIQANAIDDTLLSSLDWLPTVLSLANIPIPDSIIDTIEGQDMSQALIRRPSKLKEKNPPNSNDETTIIQPIYHRKIKPYLFWAWRFAHLGPCIDAAPQIAIRDKQYKLLRDIDDGGRVELYYLDFYNSTYADYQERINLATLPNNPYAEVITRLTNELMNWYKKQPVQTYAKSFSCNDYQYPASQIKLKTKHDQKSTHTNSKELYDYIYNNPSGQIPQHIIDNEPVRFF